MPPGYSRCAGPSFQCPWLRTRSWLGASSQGAHLRMGTSCHRQTSVSLRGDDPPRRKLDLTVWLGGLSDGDPFERHLRPSAAEAAQLSGPIARPGCWAKLRRAMVDPDRIRRRGWSRSTKPPCLSGPRTTPPAACPGRSHDGKLLVVGGIEVGDGNKPGRLRLAALTDYGAGSLKPIARNIAPASTAKTDGWAGYAGVPVNQHDPTSSAPWPQILSCPGSIRCSPTSRAGPVGSITGCAGNTCKPISTGVRLPLQPTQNAARHLPLPVRHRHPANLSPTHVGCAGTKCISGPNDIERIAAPGVRQEHSPRDRLASAPSVNSAASGPRPRAVPCLPATRGRRRRPQTRTRTRPRPRRGRARSPFRRRPRR